MNKHFVFCFLALFIWQNSYGSNSILVVIGDDIITTNQLDLFVRSNSSKKEKMEVIDILISENIISKFIKKLKIQPKDEIIEAELKKVAELNAISLNELITNPNFEKISNDIIYNLSKNALIEIIYSEELKNQKIELNSSKTSVFDKWLDKIKSQTFIDIYEKKL